MRQKYTPDMMLEEIIIALATEHCPRCNQALLVEMEPDQVTLSCPGCHWMAGGSPSFFIQLEQEVIGC